MCCPNQRLKGNVHLARSVRKGSWPPISCPWPNRQWMTVVDVMCINSPHLVGHAASLGQSPKNGLAAYGGQQGTCLICTLTSISSSQIQHLNKSNLLPSFQEALLIRQLLPQTLIFRPQCPDVFLDLCLLEFLGCTNLVDRG